MNATKVELIETLLFAIEHGFTNVEQTMAEELGKFYKLFPMDEKFLHRFTDSSLDELVSYDGRITNRIEWIKRFKTLTQCGLKEAKDEMDRRYPPRY